jgi:Trk K+ transport system NAD-binding subunit
MILYSHQLYDRLATWLKIFERRVPFREKTPETSGTVQGGIDVIIFGMGRFGSSLAHELAEQGVKVLGVDFDPELIRCRCDTQPVVVYGDADDPDFPSTLPLSGVEWIISSLPQAALNLSLLHALKAYAYKGKTAFTAHNDQDAEMLKQAGVDRVLLPFIDAAKKAAQELIKGMVIVDS